VHQRDQLAGIERRAATERHHAVIRPPCRPPHLRDVGSTGLGCTSENSWRCARGREDFNCGLRHRHLGDERIGDE